MYVVTCFSTHMQALTLGLTSSGFFSGLFSGLIAKPDQALCMPKGQKIGPAWLNIFNTGIKFCKWAGIRPNFYAYWLDLDLNVPAKYMVWAWAGLAHPFPPGRGYTSQAGPQTCKTNGLMLGLNFIIISFRTAEHI